MTANNELPPCNNHSTAVLYVLHWFMATKNKKSLTYVVLEKLESSLEQWVTIYTHGAGDPDFNLWNLSYKGFKPRYFKSNLNRLQKNQQVALRQRGPKVEARITRQGLVLWRNKKFEQLKIAKPEKWDGLWRCAIFDIPEKKSSMRNSLRRKLKELGFKQVQFSVWVCPYPCRNELVEVCRHYRAEQYVSLLEGKYLGNENNIRKQFNL